MKIVQGTCIGVLYVGRGKDEKGNPINQVKVHNGKLRCAYYKGKGWVKNIANNSKATLPDRICVVHYNIDKKTNKMYSECRILHDILQVEKTPIIKSQCTGKTLTKPVRTGECIGYRFKYLEGKNKGKYDVKNGRFVYVKKTNQTNVTCELNNGNQNNIEYLVYVHWNIDTKNGVVKMIAEPRKTKSNIEIVEIRRTPLEPSKGNCNCNC